MTDLNPYEEGLALELQEEKIRIKALQKALKDQSSVSDRLAEQLATCEKYRDAYAECDRIGTQAVRDLEDKLALMVFERDEVIKFERDEARDRAERAEAKLAKAVEALLWCSGSADFNEGGVAREGWLKVCAPLLKGESHDPL